MMSLLIAAAAVQGLASTAEVQPRYLDADGVKATYTRSVDQDGTVHLRGHYRRDRTRFHYKVRNGKVDALIGGIPYSFDAPGQR